MPVKWMLQVFTKRQVTSSPAVQKVSALSSPAVSTNLGRSSALFFPGQTLKLRAFRLAAKLSAAWPMMPTSGTCRMNGIGISFAPSAEIKFSSCLSLIPTLKFSQPSRDKSNLPLYAYVSYVYQKETICNFNFSAFPTCRKVQIWTLQNTQQKSSQLPIV